MTTKLPELLTRGVEQIVPDATGLFALMEQKKIRVYLGIDPSGNLLTLGHSVVLRKLQQFAAAGHEVILLIGNGTVRIGDPTGRDSTRPELTDEVIQENFKNWKQQASKILDFDKISIRYNGDWLDKLTYQDIVKLLAKTTIQQMVERDMFQERIKNELPIFGHEIIYPLLQGYDSVVMDVDLELGGSDQLFNMLMGRTLQKSYNNREKWVLTTPIINGTDGRKMSKSYGNFVALTEEPTEMYGKLMRIADEQIIQYFTLLTDVAAEEISEMERAMQAGENPMGFKQQLAKTIVTQYHTQALANMAADYFHTTVQQKSASEVDPTITVSSCKLSVLSLASECLPNESKNNLRRLITQGGTAIYAPDEQKITDPQQMLDTTNISAIRIGKRNYFRINHD
ncbi:MAG: tyrosine--tRNA ligase [Candidatus Pacebacteria bacterium]|nr:tyrosine--tRNA ligase [Candidatus Paceibacterota bacterium]